VRAKLKKIGNAYFAGQIGLGRFIILAKPFWDEQEEVKDELHRAFFGPDAVRDRERERLRQVRAQFELPFGYQHSLRDHELTAKITWFCTDRGTHDPMRIVFKRPQDVPGADRRTRQLLVLRNIHDGIRRLEAALRKEVAGHPGPPRPPDETTAGVPHQEHVEMVCVECRRQLRLGGRQLNRAGRSGVTDIDISSPLPF
jgi:glycosidase